MYKYTGTAILIMMCVAQLFAQDEGPLTQRIQAQKVAFITDKLQLTPDEAQQFWPVYNQYESDLKQIRQKYRPDANFLTMSDLDAEKHVLSLFDREQEELNLKKDYFLRFKKILPIRKIAMLLRAELEFKEELVKKMQEIQRIRNNRKK